MKENSEKLPKSFKLFAMIILILIIIFINPNIRKNIFNTFNLFTKSQKQLELVNSFDVDKQIEKIDISNDKIISWGNNILSFLDLNGVEIFKKNFGFKDPDIVFGQEIIYVMDKASGKIYLLDKNGETIEKLDLQTPFYKLKEKEEYIYIYKKDGDTENIDIIDRKGSILKSHEERIPILTLDIKEDYKEYAISTLNIDKTIKSVFSIYSIEGENIEDIEFKDEIIVFSKFIGDKIVIASEKNIYLLQDKKIKWNKKINNLKDIKVVDKDIYLLYNNKFEILNLKGNLKQDISLTLDLENIIFNDDNILLFGKKDIVMPQKQKDILKFKLDEDILSLKYNEENILIQKQGKVEIYNIKEKEQNNE